MLTQHHRQTQYIPRLLHLVRAVAAQDGLGVTEADTEPGLVPAIRVVLSVSASGA